MEKLEVILALRSIHVTDIMTLPENPCWMWRPAPTGFMVTSLSIHRSSKDSICGLYRPGQGKKGWSQNPG